MTKIVRNEINNELINFVSYSTDIKIEVNKGYNPNKKGEIFGRYIQYCLVIQSFIYTEKWK